MSVTFPSSVGTSIARNEVVSLTLLELHSYLRYNSLHRACGDTVNMYTNVLNGVLHEYEVAQVPRVLVRPG